MLGFRSLGILGGTFDPPHLGHLILAECARVQFRLERVLFIPSGDPYHKKAGSGFELSPPRRSISSAQRRLEMLALAIAGVPEFATDEREIRREGPSYTVETLEELAKEYPGARPVLLVGADALAEFHRWKRPERIVELALLAAAPRGDLTLDPASQPFAVEWVDMPRVDITSTLIRARRAAGKSVRYLVPPAVADYLEREGLYSERGTSPPSGP